MASLGRRLFLKLLGASASAAAAGCSAAQDDEDDSSDDALAQTSGFDVIIVGSGAGGGPLAANLARQGLKVLLLEAGDDQGKNVNYQVPTFHPKSTEDDAMRWDYYVRHYSDGARQGQDTKLKNQPGILYPRAGTLGGCTAHNAMITVRPHDSDWDEMARITGDASWSAAAMKPYFQVLEKCNYMPGAAGHGTDGWLETNRADAKLAVGDSKIRKILVSAIATLTPDGGGILGRLGELVDDVQGLVNVLTKDLNTPDPNRDATEGFFNIPLATTRDGKRNGPRDYIVRTMDRDFVVGDRVGRLTVRTNALVTRILWDDAREGGKLRASGVEVLPGSRLYGAAPGSKSAQPTGAPIPFTVRDGGEVIVSAGAFNTPQLLMLSGVGPAEHLRAVGPTPIDVKLPLAGVGKNLQDRYEVAVVTETDTDFDIIGKCTFNDPAKGTDPCLVDWQHGTGVYTSNGAVGGIVKRSGFGATNDPDLFVFCLPGDFRGYVLDYAKAAIADKRHYTWAVLKAHTQNRAGTVRLVDSNPRRTPEINFHYFDEGYTDARGNRDASALSNDLEAVCAGVELARSINDFAVNKLPIGLKGREVWPAAAAPAGDKASLREWVKNEAWGHHASCTARMGADGDPEAVLDSKLVVRGTSNVRVVDASVFPKIPGFFIVTAIYMVSERATDLVLERLTGKKRALR